MTTILTGIILIVIAMFLWFLFDHDVRNSIIHTEFQEDFDSLKSRLPIVTPATGERLIKDFEAKWTQYLPKWVVFNQTSKLYELIFRIHNQNALN